MSRPIIVIAEYQEGRLRPATDELIGFAFELRALQPAAIQVVILGDAPEEPARNLAAETGLDVVAVQEASLVRYHGELYKSILTALLEELGPVYVCIAHTTSGMDFAPGLAYRLGADCITGVESVSQDRGRIRFARALYGGKIQAEVATGADATILTITPGAFRKPAVSSPGPGRFELRKMSLPPPPVRVLETRSAPAPESELSRAPVIVAAGRGVGQKENLRLIFQLAALFPRAAVAGSRWVCDAGWLEHRRQVGLTGATVSPKLYIACGVSGSAQHLAGMRDSGFIVAVNSDPHAAIFNIADICIVEDLKTFIPILIAERQKRDSFHAATSISDTIR